MNSPVRKIAVCLSGQFRLVDRAIGLLKKNLIDAYDCDIFVVVSQETYKRDYKIEYSTSFEKEISFKLSKAFGKNLKKCVVVDDDCKMIDENHDIVAVDKNAMKEMLEKRNVWSWEFAAVNFCNQVSVEHFEEAFKKCSEHDVFVHPKTKKEYLCNELKKQYEEENNFKYDVVLATRLDLYIGDDIFKFHADLLPKTVYSHKMWECIFYGTSEVMDVATKRWNLIHKNMCNKYGHRSVNINKSILDMIWRGCQGGGGGDIGLIYKWHVNGLNIRQINDLNPSFKEGVFRSNGDLFIPEIKGLHNGRTQLDIGG